MKTTTDWRQRREQGSGGISLVWLLLTPVMLGLTFGGIAVGWRMYGSNLELDAANAGAREAALYPASAQRGQDAAEAFLARAGTGTLTDTSVEILMNGTEVVVTVKGRTPVLPGTVTRQAAVPMEVLP